MSTRILILKDGVITPAKSAVDSNAIISSLGNAFVTSVNGSTGAITISKLTLDLGLVDNTSDLSKPISTLTQNALNLKADLVDGKIPSSQLPAGSTTSLTLGDTSETAYRGDYGTIAYNHSQIVSGNPHGITATTINLGNVNNTSDANKPVSIAQQTALDLKANLISPALSGTPTAPTPVAGTNTTQIATTAFVINAVAGGGSTTTYVDLTTNQTINGIKVFSGSIQLPNNSGTTVGTIWRNGDTLEYKDSLNITKILLNSAGNLSNLGNKQTALNNLVENQTANRVLRSNGVNVVLAQVGLTTDVVDVLPIANGGTGSSTKNFVDLVNNQNIAGIKTFTDNTQATSTTTGAQIISGGQAVGGNQYIGGFTSLGDNVAIKVKRIIGTSAATQGGVVELSHGLDPSKVIGFQSLVAYQSGGYMLPNDIFYPGYEYSCFMEGGVVAINNSATNSVHLLSKPVSILIFYTS